MRLLSCIWVYVHVCVDNIKKATFGVCLLLAGVRILLISGRELVLNLRYVRRLADVEGYIYVGTGFKQSVTLPTSTFSKSLYDQNRNLKEPSV